jgi:hypothetical protein
MPAPSSTAGRLAALAQTQADLPYHGSSMIDPLSYQIRIARLPDSDAVSALLVASFSSLLPACYDSDTLGRALPFLTKANPTLLASGSYYVAEEALARQSCRVRRLDDSASRNRRDH